MTIEDILKMYAWGYVAIIENKEVIAFVKEN